MTHDTAHEEMLQQMLAGDLAPDSARSRALLERCPECSQRWRELEGVVASIDSADRERREVLAEAAHVRSAPGSDQVASTLREQRLRSFASPASPRRSVAPWQVSLLAAALLVAGFFVARALFPAKSHTDEVMMGENAIHFDEEYARIDARTVIRWRRPPSDKGPFIIQVRGRIPGGATYSKELKVSRAEWTPGTELLNEMPGIVLVQVFATDASGFKDPFQSSPEISLTVSR